MGLDFGFKGQLLMLLVGLSQEPLFVVSLMAILAGFPLTYWAFDRYRKSRRDQRDSLVAALGLGILLMAGGLAGILLAISRLNQST